MRTRRFKALNGMKGKDSRIIEKIAVYDDNDNMNCYLVHKDDYDNLYYCPSNPHDKLGLFTDKITDAIECIENGYGDMIRTISSFGAYYYKVVRFIDRRLGESIREFSLTGWRFTKFSYVIKCSPVDTSVGNMFVAEGDKLVPSYRREKILRFDTEDDANKYIDDVNKRVADLYEKYNNLKRTGDDDYDFNNIVKPFFHYIHNGSRDNLDWNWLGIVDHFNKTGKWIYEFKVIQVVDDNNYSGIQSINNRDYDQLLEYELFRRRNKKNQN